MRFLPVFFVTAAFAATHAVADEKIRAELTGYNDRYNEIIRTYDLEAFVALYSEAPLWIAPQEPPVTGRQVPRGTFGFIIEKQGQLTHTFDELFVSEDGTQAVMTGTYRLNIEQAGIKSDGTYLFVLERSGEGWKIVVDMFNQHNAG